MNTKDRFFVNKESFNDNISGKNISDNNLSNNNLLNNNLFNNDLAMLGAFCLFLSAVEYMIPKPLPFMRIGLANLPLLLALDVSSPRRFFILVCIKVFGQALITGTLFSYIFLFSLTGTFFSAMLMLFLRRFLGSKLISFIGIGTAGAIVSNISQLALAHVFIFRENVRYITPPFLAAGLVTGIILGVFCEAFTRKSKWYKRQAFDSSAADSEIKRFNQEALEPVDLCSEVSIHKSEINNKNHETEMNNINHETGFNNTMLTGRREFYENNFSAKALFLCGLLMIPALVFNPDTVSRCFQFVFFIFLVWLSGKKINIFITILVTVFIIAFNLIIPYGKVLFSVGAFKITSGALEAGIHRAVTLQALVMLSKAAVRKDLKLPGTLGFLLGESMRIFSFLTERKLRITRKNLMTEIDAMMLELSSKKIIYTGVEEIKTKPAGFFILAGAVILSWLPWIF